MRLRVLFAIFLIAVSLYSCTTFKGVPSKESVNGTFNAFYNQKVFEGFFSISNSNLRFDVVNTFGFSVYGIYADDNDVYLKDYQSGNTYEDIEVNGEDLSLYKPLIIYLMKNFDTICKRNTKKNLLVLSCKSFGEKILPTSIILQDDNYRRLRMNFYNIKIKVNKGAIQ